MGRPIKNFLEGMSFGRLTVIETYSCDKKYGKGRVRVALCRCSCGRKKIAEVQNLKRGYTRSCGCLYVDRLRKQSHPMPPTYPEIDIEGHYDFSEMT